VRNSAFHKRKSNAPEITWSRGFRISIFQQFAALLGSGGVRTPVDKLGETHGDSVGSFKVVRKDEFRILLFIPATQLTKSHYVICADLISKERSVDFKLR